MNKLLLTLSIFLSFSNICFASDTMWCGTYYETNGKPRLRLSTEEYYNGSKSCSLNTHYQNLREHGSADIELEFTHHNSSIANWRNFNNHVIAIKGKYQNGTISKPKLIANYAYNKRKIRKLYTFKIADLSNFKR